MKNVDISELFCLETLELILDNIYSGIILCDKECRIVYINNVYANLLGISKESALGKSIKDFFPNSRLDTVISEGVIELGQRCILKSDIPLVVNRIPVKKDGEICGVILQTVFKDFKSLKDLTEKLKSLKSYKDILNTAFSPRFSFESIIGHSEAIQNAKEQAKKYALSDSSVLILGSTGTGKELFAHAIHDYGPRKQGPFVCINCAGFPKDLLESELFGYQPGAFTGAHSKGKIGKIELANHGALFLDEIGDLSLNAQGKILRVLETKQLDKIGAIEPVTSNFKLIAATNKDLKKLIAQGDFREDLYYRLNAMTIRVPTLAERVEDLPLLIDHFLKDMGREEVTLTKRAMKAFENYSWPGNIRELKNTIDLVISLIEDKIIRLENLPTEMLSNFKKSKHMECSKALSKQSDTSLKKKMAQFENEVIRSTLEMTQHNMTKASKMLGISRSTLYEKCKRHGLI